jgi:histone H2B
VNLDGKARKVKKAIKLRDSNSMQTYIYRVLKEVKPELGISKKAMAQLNQILAELFENMMAESRKLMIFSKKQTLSSKEVETSIKLLYPGELGKLAVQYGRNSLQKFTEAANN